MKVLTLVIFTIMIMGLISIISIACHEQDQELSYDKKADLARIVQRLKDRGLYDMSPEVRARSKIHLKYALDSMEFCD